MEKALKKVVYLAHPAEEGVKNHLLGLLAGLDRMHYEPVVICPPGALADEAATLGVQVIPLEMAPEQNPVKDVQAALRLRTVLKKLRPDILHLHGARAGWIGRLAVRTKKRPKVVLSVYNLAFDARAGSASKGLVGKVERYFAKVTDHIIACSQAIHDELVNEMGLSPDLISVIYGGMPFRDIVRTDANEVRVGTIARLVPHNGLECFINAISLVLAKHPTSVSFTIAGEGPYRSYLYELARSLSINEAIFFSGRVQDVPATLSTFDVFALTPEHGTTGMALVEVMSQQVPVVATRVGDIPEIIEDGVTGLLAEPGNPRDIAEKISRLLEDPELLQRVSGAGCAVVRARFTTERMVDEIHGLYQELFERRWKTRT